MTTGSTARRAANSSASSSTPTSTWASRFSAASHWTGTWLWHTLCVLPRFGGSKQVLGAKIWPEWPETPTDRGNKVLLSALLSSLTAVLVSAVVWIIEVVANSAPLFHDELFQDHFNHTFCFEKYPMQDWVAGMNLYRTFLGFLAPWTAMLVAYRGILVAVRCNVSTEQQEKAKIQRLALSLILIVLLCFGPYHVLLLVRSVMFLRKPCDCGSEESLFAAYHISLALTSLNCVADPILYCFVNEGARHDVGRAISALLSAACHKGSSCSPSHGDILNAASVTMETPLSAKKQPCVYNDVGKSSNYKTELVALKEECLQMTILSVRKWVLHIWDRSAWGHGAKSWDSQAPSSTGGNAHTPTAKQTKRNVSLRCGDFRTLENDC